MKQLLALCAVIVLSACGFRPLYGNASPGQALFQRVQIEAPSDRTGYVLTDALYERFGGTGADAQYRLDVKPTLTRTGLGVSSSNIAARFEITVVVNYTLTRLSDGAVVARGAERAAAGYDVPDSPYAGIAAQTDAETRATRIAAEQVWRAVAVSLPRQP